MTAKSIILAWAMCLVCIFAQAQDILVSGRITDTSGDALMGVSVMRKGFVIGSASDIDGRYEINASTHDVLVFSCVGMKTVEYEVGENPVMNVVMEFELLDEVFVVAYGTGKKSSFTGSAEVVSAAKLDQSPVTSVSKSLDGRVAGVMATSGSGQPGSGASLRIRGYGSINASGEPLIVLDGMPYDGDLSSINSSDIESITVLKDASAGALYGARGANGVVLITTAGGRDSEKVAVGFNTKFSVMSRAIPAYSTVDAKEYMELMYNAIYNDLVYTEGYFPSVAAGMTADRLTSEILGTNAIYNPYSAPVKEIFGSDGKILPSSVLKYDEDWIGSVTADAPLRQEYQISLSGRTGLSRYMISMGYLDEDGLLRTTDFERYSMRVKLDLDIFPWLGSGVNISYSHSRSHFLGADGSNANNVWYSAQLMSPIYPVYKRNADGSFNLDANGEKQFDYGSSRPAGAQNNRNCLATLYDDRYESSSDNLAARTFLKAEWNGISLSTNLGLDVCGENQSTKFNRYNGNAEGMGRLTKEYQSTLSWTWNQLLSYSKKWGGHKIDALAGHEYYGHRPYYLCAERTGFVFGDFVDLASGSTVSQAYSVSEEYYIDSWLSRLNYEWGDRYYLSGSFRMDGSSRFAKGHRWGAFWSAGASWRISEEDFLKNVGQINNLTLKASYGVQGNDNLGTYYAWQGLYDMNYANAGMSGAVISSLENPDITWERNGNFNLGVEFRLFNRLSGTLEYYDRLTTKLLLAYPMAISQGIESYYANVGSMVNRGVDFSLNADVLRTHDWSLNLGLIASTVNNRILRLTSGDDRIVSGVYINTPGKAINSFYMSRSAGVDPASGKQLYWAYEKDDLGNMLAGSEYITSDPQVAANCKYILGSRIPDIYGSFSASLSWKGISLDLMMGYSLGGKVYDSIYQSMMEPSFVGQVYHRNALRSWKECGDLTDVPRITTTLVTAASDRFLVDASYLSLKNVSLSYNFASMLKRSGVECMKAYLSFDNPFILTHLKGMNPQADFAGSTSFSYVPTKSMTIGIEIRL